MSPIIVVSCVLGGLLALGGWERWSRDRAHQRVRIRIHVNGTRGKSTITRLIAAALREAGVRTIAKTTGTAARLILPDGTEQPVRRRGPASIREQLWVVREAYRLGADALVVECMAIDPALQHSSERDMINATIGVITNVRPDHADVMGAALEDVAQALAHTVPRSGVLVVGELDHRAIFEQRAQQLNTRVIHAMPVDPALDAPGLAPWQRQNAAVAMAVTRELAIPDAIALRAMMSVPEDPGAVTVRTRTIAARSITIVDATAANDPESLRLLLDAVPVQGDCLFVFNHRADRPLRLRQFAEAPLWKRPGVSVLVTGDAPDCATRKIVRLALEAAGLGFAPMPLVPRALRDRLAREHQTAIVVFCGNSKHLDVEALLDAGGGV